jgi:hypothetical protein
MKKLPPPREVLMKIIIDGFDRALAKDLSPEDRTALLGYRNEFESSFLPMIDHLRFDPEHCPWADDHADSDFWVSVLMEGCFNAGATGALSGVRPCLMPPASAKSRGAKAVPKADKPEP